MMRALAAVLVTASLVPAARAVDENNMFAVKGAGLQNCARFVAEREAQSPLYYNFLGWLDGYLTGMNELQPNTYDITVFESIDLLAKLIDQHCREHPEERFAGVARALVDQLEETRIETRSELQSIEVDGEAFVLYTETVERLQVALKEGGFLEGSVDGKFGPATRAALQKFQAAQDIEPTGRPDQITLLRLLRQDR